MFGLQFGFFQRRKLPLVLQTEIAECGLASLAMVINFYGHEVTLSELRRRFSISLKGATLKSLIEIANSFGMISRPLRAELGALRNVQTPSILHWDLSHFVVLKRITPKFVEIHDPSTGLRRMQWDEVSKHFTGVVLELQPSATFTKKTSIERVRLTDLWSGIRGLAPSIAQLFLLSLVLQVFSLTAPVLNQMVIDDVISKGDLDLLTVLIIGITLMLLIQIATSLLRGIVSMHFSALLSLQMGSNLLLHLLRLPIPWFEKRHLGDIASRFGSLKPIQDFLSNGIVSVGLDGLMSITTLVVMFIYSPPLTVIALVSLASYICGRSLTFPLMRRIANEGINLSAKEQSSFLETVRGARAFKLAGQELGRHALWQNARTSVINNSLKGQRFGLLGSSFGTFLSGVESAAILYFGARYVLSGELTLGMLLAFQSYRGHFIGSAFAIVNQIFIFKMTELHLARLADVVHQDVESKTEPHFMALNSPHEKGPMMGSIQMIDVCFRYADEEPWILRHANISIKPGEFVVFIGQSGGGKSTLLKLLMGLYSPAEGQILIDGRPLQSFGLRNYRRQLGVVMQDDQLFAGTLADNISLFDPELDMQRIEEVTKLAAIHHDIMHMPMRFMTVVGDLGSTLSAGQRQRLLLARALYRRPSILFLDEGTANLDPHNEQNVISAIKKIPITRIVVAHRPAVLEVADRVFGVRHGFLEELTQKQQPEEEAGERQGQSGSTCVTEI